MNKKELNLFCIKETEKIMYEVDTEELIFIHNSSCSDTRYHAEPLKMEKAQSLKSITHTG